MPYRRRSDTIETESAKQPQPADASKKLLDEFLKTGNLAKTIGLQGYKYAP